MSSKTLAVTVEAGRLTGAVIESSIGSLKVTEVFDVAVAAGETPLLPTSGPFDRIVATLPSEAAAFRILDLPFRDRRRVAQAVGPALEEHVPFSLDDGVLVWDFVAAGGMSVPAPAGGATAGASVLAAIAETSRLEAAGARLTGLGVEGSPERLLWFPSVVLTAYRRAVGEDASFTLVDIGDGGAIVARIEGGSVTAMRIVAPCDDDLLLRNVTWSLATVSRGGDAGRTVVGGRHGARLGPAIAKRVTGMVVEALPVSSPVEGLGGRDWREIPALVGLVLAASGDGLAPVLDFEAGAGSFLGVGTLRELQEEARPLLRWGAAALALAVLAIGLDYVQLFAERRTLAGRAEQLYTSAMPSGSGGVGRKLKMEMRLRELTGKAEAAAGGGAGSPLALLAALSRDVPKSLDIVIDQVEHAPPSAKVAGHAASFEAVTKMQEALQKQGSFARVEVKDVHAAVTGGGVEFLLELTTAASGAGA